MSSEPAPFASRPSGGLLCGIDLGGPLFLKSGEKMTELRLEDEVSKLLDREQLADDLKVKVLSQLLIRYQNIAREPSGPVRVSIVDEKRTS
ncbi:hypothetical protein TNCV_3497021 [Trichonephila clavipes]|nr:hypothetical protein TNCV_3497021 [Trichonephila clavipes]